MDLEDLRKIERKWQRKWSEAKIFEADPDERRPKFFLTVPYPYTSGPLHIGHGRTYTIGDIIARYKRLQGYNVLFPMAFHITGTPIAAISDRISRGDMAAINVYREYILMYEEDKSKIDEILESFKNPFNVATYFAERISIDFTSLGYSIDWRRRFHTGEQIYNKFIEWQYYKLKELGLLKKGSHYVTFCLLHKQPEGEDDIQDADVNPVEIVEFVAIKFRYRDGYILASTLRPETIFGATNLWANPNVTYVKTRWNGETYYMSKEATVKFNYQYKNLEIIAEVPGESFVGEKAISPLGEELLILPAFFVDPDTATGFVYSEPSDAPYDYVALMELKKKPELLRRYGINPEEVEKISPIKIIDIPGVSGHHAEKVVREMGITSQTDPRLEDATKLVYKEQYYNGVMNEKAGEFAGLSVNEAKERVKEWLTNTNNALIFYETSRKAFCRAGGKIIIARIDDQWFIDYSQEWWKEKTRKWLKEMVIIPEKFRKAFLDTVDWLHERPCARKRGLGTRLPFDPEWIIESLSDSTIYMAFYTISHIIRKYDIKPEQLKPELFDFVFLGIGNVDSVSKVTGIPHEAIEEMRREFEYWYPVDQRHTGIPHISNHLTFYIMHHIAIFREKHWPKMITLNELVIREGRKMSKSKGNVILLKQIAEEYSSDLFRIYVASAADLDTILDWRGKEVQSVKSRLLKFANLAFEATKCETSEGFGEKIIDKWLLSRFYRRLQRAKNQMDNLKFREFIISMFFEMLKDLNYYERRTNHNRLLQAVRQILPEWVIVLSPIIPHLAEEIWEKLGNRSFVSLEKWPSVDKSKIDSKAEALENIVRDTLESIKEILKALKKESPKRCYVIIASDWKRDLYKTVGEIIDKYGYNIGIIMREVMARSEFKSHGKLVADIINKIVKRKEIIPEYIPTKDDEYTIFTDAREFLEREVGGSVEVLTEDKALEMGITRAENALPTKPGLYIEF